ncbi:septal ring lytic transglycosylase RlpA family protein [Roseomonas populi]|uniref:Septal ring lytic transglycosylase RlpA family protein n=1 Tax=Roseomonas populi TaxID=3121582 RepID=A0ABT1XCD1_9PROT|nr:septal ring lytic transglycosylase RlpA family protein [Roseomonas pecuniae]MCR0985785.1 septal ring lytic transglycosylase RlpA family protein [Roseomonas pecuniae]
MSSRGAAGLVIAAVCILQACPLLAAPREQAPSAIIEVAPRAAPAPARSADRSGKARQTQARVLNTPALANAAAVGVSGVLPRGTTARVQNLQNGRSTMVLVQPGGPDSEGRLLDITPPVARALGVTGSSAEILVAPLAVPQADGTIRLGEGTRMAGAVAAPALSDRPQD